MRARRLQPASLRVYDFEQHAWVQQHALTRVSEAGQAGWLLKAGPAQLRGRQPGQLTSLPWRGQAGWVWLKLTIPDTIGLLVNNRVLTVIALPPPPQFPPELPVSRWAVASLLNKMKKKESSIFLVRPCPFLGASQHWAEQCQEPACPAS